MVQLSPSSGGIALTGGNRLAPRFFERGFSPPDLVRFWAGFIEATQMVAPGFGADAADLLAMDGVMSADVTASIASDAAKLPAGSAIIADDFHYAAATVGKDMTRPELQQNFQ
jgi:hypothetical protein